MKASSLVKSDKGNNPSASPNPLDIHPNIKGYQEMAEKIMEYLETNKVL